MNEGQRKRIAIEMESAIPTPLVFESENGSIEILKMISHSDPDAPIVPIQFNVPDCFCFELVRIDANGKVLLRRTAIYKMV